MMKRLASLLCVLAFAGLCLAAADEKEKPDGEAAAPKAIWSEDFEAYEPTGAWTGDGVWKVTAAEGFVGHFAIGADYGKDGKGLLTLNENEAKVGKGLGWLTASRVVQEAAGKEQFVFSLDYQVPTMEDRDIHRVDVSLSDVGAGGRMLFFLQLDARGVSTIFRDGDKEGTRKATYISAKCSPAGQWNHVDVQVDQKADRFRVLVNGAPAAGPDGEWCYYRYDYDARPDLPKSIAFNTADAWKGSRRFIDNIAITEPTEAWEVK